MKQILSILTVIFVMILLSGQGAQAQDDWTLKTVAPEPSSRDLNAMASLGGDQVLLFGGFISNDETWVYDLSDNTWTLKSPATKPSGRYSHAMASLGGDQVMLFGGVTGFGIDGNVYSDETWVYDLSDNTWTLKSPATKPSARSHHGMAPLGGEQVLLFGGIVDGAYNDETWVYDLSDNTWTLKNPATNPFARTSEMASLGSDQVLLFGGYPTNDQTWVYDLSDNTWTLKSPATGPSLRFGHAMASLGGDQVLLFGGQAPISVNDETWVYDLSDNNWTLKTPATKPSGREGHSMASLGGEQVLLFGGAAHYNPGDDTWVYTATPSLCADITSMVARCIGGDTKTVQVRVNLLNNIIHAGEMVTIAIDDSQFTATIISNGTSSRANFSVPGWIPGDHIVSLVDPPGCLADVHTTCVASDGIAKADPVWDDDAELTLQNLPQAPKLIGNYPNPSNPSTTILYALSQDAHVRLVIYNMLGQLVATLVDEQQGPGYKSVVWNGRNDGGGTVASGIYIYRITTGGFTDSKRMLLIK